MHCRLNSILLTALNHKLCNESKVVNHLNYLHKFKTANSWEFKFLIIKNSENNCNQTNINNKVIDKPTIEFDQNSMLDDELLKQVYNFFLITFFFYLFIYLAINK